MNTHKYLTLDAIRGVAALFVLLRHASESFGGLGLGHSYLAVDIFFIMSGFVIAHVYDQPLASGLMSLREFLKVRLVRLYPLYLLGLVLAVVLSVGYRVASGTAPMDGLLAAKILFGLLLLPAPLPGGALFPLNGPAWSIFFELFSNVVYAMFRSRLSLRVLMAVVAGSALALLSCAVIKGSVDFGFNWKNAVGGFPRVMFSFGMGLLIHRLGPRLPWDRRTGLLPCAAVLMAVAGVLAVPELRYNWLYDMVCICLILPALVLAATRVEPGASWMAAVFSWLGLISYAIYILQMPFLTACELLFGSTPPLGGMVAALMLFCVVAKVLDRSYDQPMRRWLRRRLSPTEPRLERGVK